MWRPPSGKADRLGSSAGPGVPRQPRWALGSAQAAEAAGSRQGLWEGPVRAAVPGPWLAHWWGRPRKPKKEAQEQALGGCHGLGLSEPVLQPGQAWGCKTSNTPPCAGQRCRPDTASWHPSVFLTYRPDCPTTPPLPVGPLGSVFPAVVPEHSSERCMTPPPPPLPDGCCSALRFKRSSGHLAVRGGGGVMDEQCFSMGRGTAPCWRPPAPEG